MRTSICQLCGRDVKLIRPGPESRVWVHSFTTDFDHQHDAKPRWWDSFKRVTYRTFRSSFFWFYVGFWLDSFIHVGFHSFLLAAGIGAFTLALMMVFEHVTLYLLYGDDDEN